MINAKGQVLLLLSTLRQLHAHHSGEDYYKAFLKDVRHDNKGLNRRLSDLEHIAKKVKNGIFVDKGHQSYAFLKQNVTRIENGFKAIDYLIIKDQKTLSKLFENFVKTL